jgi:hypothetical protein
MVDYKILRELFRNLRQFEALYEAEGVDTIKGPDGSEYCLFDIKRIYEARVLLSLRQSQAIAMFLVDDIRERDVAGGLGVSEVNPVAIYATQGLRRLCWMYETGVLPGMEESDEQAEVRGIPGAGGRG